MKKALGQTVRDIKREVNKKVLKVPGIEQKVLDATSNEPWGPHGSLLADIAHASKNFNEYQMIMTVIWKRINDIGKNWRHVYKGLTVLEYLVAHGSERVIEEIKEHSYQISTLSDFQYIDSGGRDQGSNVRKKSQSLVVLVNDKERIIEVRQKAAANKDKFRNASSTGEMYRPGSGGYGDRYDEDRYGNREDDKNGYGREREWGNKDDDRYGKIGDNSSRGGDRYGRDNEERYGRASNRDGGYQGRSRSVDDYSYGSRSKSADRDRDHAYDDDVNSSSRGSGARVDENSQEPRHIDRKFSEQNLSAPPSYEEAVNDARSPVHSESESPAVPAPKPASPPASTSASQAPNYRSTLAPATTQGFDTSAPATNQGVETFDEFDPRGSFSAAPTSSNSNGAEMDLLGSLSDSFNALAIVPTTPEIASYENDVFTNSDPGRTHSAPPSVIQQAFDDPFGDSPFKASPVLEGGGTAQTQGFPSTSHILGQNQPCIPKVDETSNFSFGDTFPGISFTPPTTNIPNQDIDILADILPPSGSLGQLSQPTLNTVPNTLYHNPEAPNVQFSQHNGGFQSQAGFTGPAVVNGASFIQQSGTSTAAAVASQMPYQTVNPMASNNFGNYLPQSVSAAPVTTMGQQLAIVPQPSNDKFQTKSTVWADTLNRGLVNLNISGSKTNPLADIGIDFDAINRKEKRMEKPSATPVTSNINMGKAMGSGTGIGRAGAIRPSPNPMMARPGMGLGMAPGVGMTPGTGMGVVGYGGMNQPMGTGMGMNQPMGMGMGMGMGMNQSMGLGMNQPMGMGMGMDMNMNVNQQGVQMQQQPGMPQTMQGGYNPMMGTGGYAPQQYHQGYR